MKAKDRLLLLPMLLMMLVCGWSPEVASACELEQSYNYMVMLQGSDKMKIQLPLYDKDGIDCWLVEGNVYIQIESKEKETLFHCESEHNIDDSDYKPLITCYKGVDGTMVLNRTRGYSQVTITRMGTKELCPCLENKTYALVDLLWDIPDKYRGKTVTISWYIHHDGNTVAEADKTIDVKATTFTIPSAPAQILPTVMDPVIAFDAGKPNQMMVPYMMATTSIKEITAYYKYFDSRLSTFWQRVVTLDTLKTSDFVYLPADERAKGFYIQATYKDGEGKVRTTASTPIDLPLLHHAKNLTASLKDNGHVEVKWNIEYPEWKDLSDNDSWEIQRNLSGSPNNAQWMTIGQLEYNRKTTDYVFEDESFLTSYQDNYVYYRVRRVTTAVWNWCEGSGYAMTMLPDIPALPTVSGGTVCRAGNWTESSHGVTVQFNMGWHQNYCFLRNAEDWKNFAQRANSGEAVNAIMMADIDLGTEPLTMVGTLDSPYNGNFEGNGHTLTFNPPINNEKYAAPFQCVGNATIRNLHTKGSITTTNQYAAGLVGLIMTNSRPTIENCISSVNLKSTKNGEAYIGGLIAIVVTRQDVQIRNCLFDGSIEGENCNNNGGLVGNSATVVYISNCLFAPSRLNTNLDGCETFGPRTWVENSAYLATYGGVPSDNRAIDAKNMSAAALRDYLGDSWMVSEGKVVPIVQVNSNNYNTLLWDNLAKVVLNIDKMVGDEVRYTERHELTDDERTKGVVNIDLKTACVDHRFRMVVERGNSKLPVLTTAETQIEKTETGEQAIYKFDNNVVLSKATAETLQNGVKLSWEAERGQADYYRILRYDKMTPEKVDTLQKNYTQNSYLDYTVRPQHNYTFIIEGVTLCEGNNISKVKVDGSCKPTGMVRGYVRLPNGTGLPGYTVTAQPVDNIPGAEVRSCVTDETGYFEIDNLIYTKYGEYMLSVSDPTGEASFSTQTIAFDDNTNLKININFTQPNYYVFSGYVLYEGSSIPVSDVHFLRDGKEVVNASGKPVTTDNQGAFSLSVPQGSHQIQIVKEGHVFKDKGFFITPDAKPDSTWHNWTRNVSQVYLWDQTKVTLQGRVVGGKEQGELPLGKSLSKNNLGDDLTLVFQLEGDNTSWMVRDQMDATVTERHEKITHGKNDTTSVDVYRHRIVIHPDVKTGEYQLPLYPVKYKVTEIYAKGYPTLFQTGMVSETLDLHHCLDGDTAVYKRIYHSEPTLDIWQFTGSNDKYYGIKQYTSMDIAGTRDTIQVWHDGHYSLGHPVFIAGASVPMLLSAREEYRYNNEQLGELDVVQLNSGKVIINNGLIASDHSETLELDKDGQATYVFTPQNATFMLKDDMALRTLKMTLLYDGSYYDIKPINAFIMASRPKSEGRRIIAGRNTHLIDILRDPPGGASYSYIERGSKFSYSYTSDLTITGGVNLSFGMGYGSNYYTGAIVAPPAGSGTEAGTIMSSSNVATFTYSLTSGKYSDWINNYEFETKERISTSDNVREIGANSDVYIGMTDDVIVEDALAIRIVNKKGLELLRPGLGGTTIVDGHEYKVTGTTEVLARGWDETKKDSIYLIRDEVMQFSTKISSTFIHTQHYLLEELIPNLLRQRNDMLLDYTASGFYAQDLANQQKSPVYVSKVAKEDAKFGDDNSYTIYYPKDMPNTWNDSIQALNSEIKTWAGFIAANEKEKLEARDLVKVYDFDGASSVEYSETFISAAGMHRYTKLPTSMNVGGNIGVSTDDGKEDASDTEVKYQAAGVTFSVGIGPVFGFDFNYNNGVDSTYTKTVGFTMACSRRSNLSVAVYHENPQDEAYFKELNETGSWDGVYFTHVEENLKEISRGIGSYIVNRSVVPRCRNLVFRTLGGATASPWEDEVRTIFYNKGTILDQKTMEIDKLRIWAKEASVSNVPYGEPARFTIYMTNESEFPDRVTRDLKYYLEDATNAGGAKVLVDGFPLTVTGIDLWLEPNTVIEKQIEVYAGAGYDYENIGISLFNTEDALLDAKRVKTVSLSAHFVPAAGPVNISRPGDKWVVNTESAYDEEEKAYYLPVHIDGFDVNFRNFDHIELQYKLSTQGDKDWVNVCSYYRDNEEGRALMEQASGERKLIKSEGHIDAAFYGEKDPVEQYYDIRAVTYCRQGSGYLTRSSNILTGIKDTRRPQVFGNPKPLNGILGIGDDISITFSEPIASNYLSKVNNFEVLGMTKSSNITQGVSLHFPGHSGAFATAARDLSNRSFTFDMMIDPAEHTKDECILHHGDMMSKEPGLQLGLTKDNRLMAVVKDTVVYSKESITFDGFKQIAYVFDTDVNEKTTQIHFYEGNKSIGTATYNGVYDKMGQLLMGIPFYDPKTMATDETTTGYNGKMLEFRLWNRALTGGELTEYGQKELTGYELGLTDNYPMNEGKGDVCYDKAVGGSDLQLVSATWSVPAGLSLKLDGQEGVVMNEVPFTRTAYQDYTLMFWFKTADQNGTLLANGEAREELGAKSRFNIGVTNGMPYFRSGNKQVEAKGIHVSDDKWHHLAVTVNRSRNVGNLYIDYNSVNTFSVDTLGGIVGGQLAAGATCTDRLFSNALKGNIDELAMYEMSLPVNVIQNYATTMPSGKELGTMVYLPFNVTEVQPDNTQRIMPSGVSIKQTRDSHGEYSLERDTIISKAVADACCDREYFAPINNTGQRENLNFSYVADRQNLLLNLDESEANLEKTNVYIVVKGVSDLQGNQIASPVMMDLYVYRNPLRWTVKQLSVKTKYGESATLEATITNQSGRRHNYTLEQLPVWITPSQTSGTLEAMGEETITLTISPYINIGDYTEKINLVDEDGMNEPLPIRIEVRGEEPDWAVSDALKSTNITMNIIARVKIDGVVADDANDIIGVFGNNHETLGMTHLNVDNTANGNEALTFLTVYNYNSQEQVLRIEYFDASKGQIYVLTPEDGRALTFQADKIIGTTSAPLVLVNSYEEVQTVQLKKGWNWISFYVVPKTQSIKQLLNGATKWEVGDALETTKGNSTQMISYKAVKNKNNPTRMDYFWDNEDDQITIDPTRMYRFYSVNDKKIYIAGEYSPKYIDINKGWNRVAYNSKLNLPIATAMSDYTERGTEGDIIKSQDAFAILTVDAGNNRSWKGNLTHLQIGQGYMIKSGSDEPLKFLYPIYSDNTRYSGDENGSRMAPLFHNATANTMNIIAQAVGIETQVGDRLQVFRGAEMCGMTEINADQVFFLSVGDTESTSEGLSFAIEREGEIIAVTGDQMVYQSNMVVGTADNPTAINFATVSNMQDGEWYDIQGRKLTERPTRKGVYIYNGQKQIVK